MPYPASLLSEGEEILLESRQHWSALRDEIGYTLAWLILWWIWVPWLDVALDEWIAWILTVGWIALVGRGIARWNGTEVVLTSMRLIYRQGVFDKSSSETDLSRLVEVGHRQSLWQRLVGAGDLVIDTGGHDGKTLIPDVYDPVGLTELVEEARQASSTRAKSRSNSGLPGEPRIDRPAQQPDRYQITPRWQTSRAEQLEILARLHTDGKLTDEEFMSEKRRVLESD